MIPYEELSAALERFAARRRGETPAEHHHEAAHAHAHHEHAHEHAPPTAEHDLPPVPDAHAALGGGEDEQTHVGEMQPVTDERSNEIDIGDVITDEENPS